MPAAIANTIYIQSLFLVHADPLIHFDTQVAWQEHSLHPSQCANKTFLTRLVCRYKTGLRGKTYSFSRVFDGKTTQEAYFDATAGPMVRHPSTCGQFNVPSQVQRTNK